MRITGYVACILSNIFLLLTVTALMLLYITRLKRRILCEQDLSRSIIENSNTMVILCSSSGVVTMLNKYAQEITGYTLEEAEGKKINDISFFNTNASLGEKLYSCMSGNEPVQNMETCLTCKDRSLIYAIWNINVITTGKNDKSVVAIGTDITERRKAEHKLRQSYEQLENTHREQIDTEEKLLMHYKDLNEREHKLRTSEERYRLAIEGSNDGIWDWDAKNGILFMSKHSRRILGFDENSEITLGKWLEVISKGDDDRFIYSFCKYLRQHNDSHYQMDYRVKTQDNKVRWIRTRGMQVWDENGVPVRAAGSNTDITDQKLADEKIHRLAYYDALTGLPNRRLLLERFSVAMAEAKQKNDMIAVYFFDIDNFKTINDTIGHSFGDQLLVNVGELINKRLHRCDTVARLGGDEFIMLQTNVKNMNDVCSFAERILDIFKQNWILDDHAFYVTASMGISIYPHDGTSMNELMKNADTAMYRAKAQGKNNFQVFTKELNKQLIERMEMENCLRRAVERLEFDIFYQPQVDTRTGRAVGNEALLRWHNGEKGWISPEVFIPIAEEIGLINKIGEWVMRNACIQLAKWHEEGFSDIKVSVNLSAKQFQQGDFFDTVNTIIDETGIQPEWLELEITESLAMQDLDHTVNVLQRLRRKGVSISMDDFGKGYSSLNYLWRLPINNLKIDKTFIHNITTDSKQAKIAKALITLAHSMQLTVTAEGVETLEQFRFLKDENCDLVQGYLFSKPKSADELCMECVDLVAAVDY